MQQINLSIFCTSHYLSTESGFVKNKKILSIRNEILLGVTLSPIENCNSLLDAYKLCE